MHEYTPGIWSVSTAGHGGLKLDRKHQAGMNKNLKQEHPWYEEDCEWSKVVVNYPQYFDTDFVAGAIATVKNWYPDEYTAFSGIPVTLEESLVLRDRKFAFENSENWVGIAAWGSWHENVPKGWVGVCATIGGKRSGVNLVEERYFLVSDEEYAKRDKSQVIDVARHMEWIGPDKVKLVG